MSTTQLFVELVVIGVGAVWWVFAWVCALLGTEWTATLPHIDAGLTAITTLVFSYVLGIIVDRMADAFATPATGRLKVKYFGSIQKYREIKRQTLTDATLAKQYEYSRSRLRICRGWAVNALLSIPALLLLIFRSSGTPPLEEFLQATVVATVLLALGSAFAWRQLLVSQYQHMKSLTEFPSLGGRSSTRRLEKGAKATDDD